MSIIKEIRLAGTRESISWSRKKEEDNPETKGETITIVPVHCMGVIRTNAYACGLDHFQRLAEIAIAQFPTLKTSDLSIKQYGGDSYARTFGIEFDCPEQLTEAPEGWTVIKDLALTL